MKRLNSSDSLGALMTVCSSQEKNLEQLNTNSNNSNVYSRGFQSMLEGLDEEDVMEESGHVSEKKRRLSVDQVKALEKNFEVENKLEPERKVKLAQELGLQPRQVAVWFQNRRARWKTKQLERDYGVLKANYDTLKLNFESLQKEKESLVSELKELKSKVVQDGDGDGDEDEDGNTTSEELYIKKEMIAVSESLMVTEHNEIPTTNSPIQNNGAAVPVFVDYKDGSSDSDSSAILNDENNNNNNNNTSSPNAGMCSSEVLNHQHLSNMSPASSSLGGFNGSSSSPSQSSINCFPFTDSRSITQKAFQHQQFARMEEHNFFGAEETCNFFSDDQAPTLQWYYSTDQWT